MILLVRRRVGEEDPVFGAIDPQALHSSFDALIFDVDGTLADTEELHRSAFNEAFRAFGLEWSWDRELYAELLRVTGGKERILSYMEQCVLPSAERKWLERLVPDIHATKTELYNELLERGRVPARTGILRLIREARLAGIKLAIASTTSPQNVDALLRASFDGDSIRWFDVIVTGDVVERKKPAPDIYELALSRLGVPADRAIAFEDSEIGVRAASAAGVFTVAVPIHWTARQDFAGADLLLPSLGDPELPLPAADEWRIGAPFLGLEQLATVHSARARVEG